MSILPYSHRFDQQTMSHLLDADPLVQRYRTLFALFDWSVVPDLPPDPSQPGKRPHPVTAYLKALLLKLEEGLTYCTRLRQFLVEHPLLVLELGFRPVLNRDLPYGFDVERTVPSDRWFRSQQQHLSHTLLQTLLMRTVELLDQEIPALGEVVSFDVTHMYAWVRENNPRVYVDGPFDVSYRCTGDPDCRIARQEEQQPAASRWNRQNQERESVWLWLWHGELYRPGVWRYHPGGVHPTLQ